MTRVHTDLSRVAISVAPSPATSGTSLGVTDANAAFLPDTYPYWAVLVPVNVAPTRANSEIVKVTGGSSSGGTTTLTIVRSQGTPVTTAQTVTTSFDIYDANSAEANIGLNSLIIGETPSGTVNGSNAAFDTASTYVAGTIEVFRDGQRMAGGGADYTETDSNTITFTTAPVTGSVLLVNYQHTVSTTGNADTLDGYHANTAPTSGYVPVLDSETAMISGGMSRQAIMNGNFDIWQRGTTATNLASNALIADRWKAIFAVDGGTAPTIVSSRQSITPGDLPGSFYHYRLAPNGAGSGYGANSAYYLDHRIENGTRYLCGASKKVTLSFWAKSSIASKRIGISLLQDYGTGGSPSSIEILKGGVVTLTSSWAKYTVTVTTNTLVGKTFGTGNDDIFRVTLWTQWGATLGGSYLETSVSAESWVGSGNIDIAQVQLCSGDIALPFKPKSLAQELADCSRYYHRNTAGSIYQSFGSGFNASTSASNIVYILPVEMRISPTISNGGNILVDSGADAAVTGLSIGQTGKKTLTLNMAVSGTPFTANQPCMLVANNDITAYIAFDAEL